MLPTIDPVLCYKSHMPAARQSFFGNAAREKKWIHEVKEILARSSRGARQTETPAIQMTEEGLAVRAGGRGSTVGPMAP